MIEVSFAEFNNVILTMLDDFLERNQIPDYLSLRLALALRILVYRGSVLLSRLEAIIHLRC